MSDDLFRNLQPGLIVNNRYEVVRSLGSGSMGTVYACHDCELDNRLIAMKVLSPEVAADRVGSARFKNEIIACNRVTHPNVVRAYEYFVDRDLDIIAYTMEHVGGGTLEEFIGCGDLIPIAEVIKILIQMCCGVSAIHRESIIHRDLKPANILITDRGDIKIADFGIARCHDGQKLTEYGAAIGTIDYVSPEYLELGKIDTRSDIYALGVLGYEMIAGRVPFGGGQSVMETMMMRLRTDPRPLTDFRKDCPPALIAVISRAMQRNCSERYQNAEDMIPDLESISALNHKVGSSSITKSGDFLVSVAQPASTQNVRPKTNGATITQSRSSRENKNPDTSVNRVLKSSGTLRSPSNVSAESRSLRANSTVLLVFVNQNTLMQLRQCLNSLGYRHIMQSSSHYNALERMRERSFSLVFFEASSSNVKAADFVHSARKLDDKSLLIAVSGAPRVDDVFGLLREGARHYIVLPFDVDSVEHVLLSAQEGPPLSDTVLHATDRNVSLATVVINGLDQLAVGMRQARTFPLAVSELGERKRRWREALDLALMFCDGPQAALRERIIEACIARASQASTRLGRTRRKLRQERLERFGISEEYDSLYNNAGTDDDDI